MKGKMNRGYQNRPARHKSIEKVGFSLTGICVAVAIIAVLLAVALPRVFAAITTSHVNETMMDIDSVKAATTESVAKFGTVPRTHDKSRVDDLLITTGMLEQRFSARIGAQGDPYAAAGATWAFNALTGKWRASGGSNQQNQTRVISVGSTTADPATAKGRNYQFDGSTPLPAGSRVVSAALTDVPAGEARELSLRIDGPGASKTERSLADGRGRVVYDAPDTETGLTQVYVYIAHQ